MMSKSWYPCWCRELGIDLRVHETGENHDHLEPETVLAEHPATLAEILDCIYYILQKDDSEKESDTESFKVELFKQVETEDLKKEDILQAVIALKLAMNLYPLQKKREDISNEWERL